MIPILYKPDAKTKIGWLAEASDCQCTEERNGVFELEFQYPMLGRYAADLVIDRYVKAKPNASAANQFFHIRKVSKRRRRMIIHTIELQLSPHPPHPPQFVAAKSLM